GRLKGPPKIDDAREARGRKNEQHQESLHRRAEPTPTSAADALTSPAQGAASIGSGASSRATQVARNISRVREPRSLRGRTARPATSRAFGATASGGARPRETRAAHEHAGDQPVRGALDDVEVPKLEVLFHVAKVRNDEPVVLRQLAELGPVPAE